MRDVTAREMTRLHLMALVVFGAVFFAAAVACE